MKCPICSTNRATSNHRIQLDNGGSNNHKDKIMLCRSCYDIVEATGKELSPQLIDLIKLEHNFPNGDTNWDVARAVFTTFSYRLRRKRKFASENHTKPDDSKSVAMRCPYCGKWHYPGKDGRVICPVLKATPAHIIEANVFHNNIMGRIRKVREILE